MMKVEEIREYIRYEPEDDYILFELLRISVPGYPASWQRKCDGEWIIDDDSRFEEEYQKMKQSQ